LTARILAGLWEAMTTFMILDFTFEFYPFMLKVAGRFGTLFQLLSR